MSRDSVRYLAVIGVLAVGLLAAGLFIWLPSLRPSPAAEAGFTFVSDIDNWQQTDQWRILHTPYDFSLESNLDELPLQLGEWSGEDIPQSNLEVFILLEPEQYVYRRYQNASGQVVWVSLIGSRKSKSFHPPQICYSTDGWRTQVSSVPVALPEGEVYALRLDATKEEQRHLIAYFYLWPDTSRDPAKGTVLFKVTVPLVNESVSMDEAFLQAQDFVAQVFTQGSGS